jgi:hypothetical protein
MGISQYDPAVRGWPAWHDGRQVGAKRALKVWQVWAIRLFLDREGRMRHRAPCDLNRNSFGHLWKQAGRMGKVRARPPASTGLAYSG